MNGYQLEKNILVEQKFEFDQFQRYIIQLRAPEILKTEMEQKLTNEFYCPNIGVLKFCQNIAEIGGFKRFRNLNCPELEYGQTVIYDSGKKFYIKDQLIQSELENETMDYKFYQLDRTENIMSLVKLCSSFLNRDLIVPDKDGNVGKAIIGVNDEKRKIQGIRLKIQEIEKFVEALKQQCSKLTYPDIQSYVKVDLFEVLWYYEKQRAFTSIEFENQKLFIIEVLVSRMPDDRMVCYDQKYFFQRKGPSNRELRAQEMIKYIQQGRVSEETVHRVFMDIQQQVNQNYNRTKELEKSQRNFESTIEYLRQQLSIKDQQLRDVNSYNHQLYYLFQLYLYNSYTSS